MDRPALQRLLDDVRAGKIDVVVVYKVDRLTRSLADFAKIVEVFDAQGVSFVSVTQAFNTTSSMGRLTLNVLLSFAQFEREVTGERIRDKIAASKAKGMWMGGRPPLGYDARDQKLVVNEEEAATVRHIFERYLELGSVTTLTIELRDSGVRSKRWTNRRGELAGGVIFMRGALYHLLSNPIYCGAIRHRERIYEGAHTRIIDQGLWDRVQAMLAVNGNETPDSERAAALPMLQGRLFDDRGNRMGPLHTQRRGRRYRYYVSAALKPASAMTPGSLPRIAVGVLDDFLSTRLEPALADGWRPDLPPTQRVNEAIDHVSVGAERIVARLKLATVRAAPRIDGATCERIDVGFEVAFAIRLKYRQGALVLAAPGQPPSAPKIDRALVRGLCLAKIWAERLASGADASIKELARAEGLCDHYAARLMPLAFLAPDLAQQILEGRQPDALSLGALTKKPLPMAWEEQRRLFAELA